jgi:hypothetical protein
VVQRIDASSIASFTCHSKHQMLRYFIFVVPNECLIAKRSNEVDWLAA